MSRIPARFKNRMSATIVACGLLVVIATVLNAFGLARSRRAQILVRNETLVKPDPNAQPNQERVEVELVTVRRDGMDPKEIIRPAGRFILAVDNRSGVPDLNLRLEGGPGRTRVQGKIPSKKLSWKQSLNLPPGTYTLSEINHSDWACRITITAR